MPINNTLARDSLRRIKNDKKQTELVRQLANLRIKYSEDAKLLQGYINQLIGTTRLYPRLLPTQASGRWSTLDPPLTNFPRACINPNCIADDHEWDSNCWSVRDILLPDSDEVLVVFDLDNVEGRIHDLIVNDVPALEAHREGYDLHTLTCCDIFGYTYPENKRNPHSSHEDAAWRTTYHWAGKDTRQRVLAKNFSHGSRYTKTYKFVHRIQGIEQYGVSYTNLEQLAKNYIASKGDAWRRKLSIMDKIQKERVARTLYGFRRVFFDSSEETGREGFSHMISGTVSDYINHTLYLFENVLGDSVRLIHNAHDGLKLCIKKDNIPTIDELRGIIQRDISYGNRTLTLTATVKVYDE